MAPNDGLQIPISLVFKSNLREFRGDVGAALTEIGTRARAALAQGNPYTPQQVRGLIARTAGQAGAEITRNVADPAVRERELKRIERQAQAQAREIAQMAGYEGVKAPTSKEIARSRAKAEKDAERAAVREAKAADQTAKAEEQRLRQASAAATAQSRADAAATAAKQAQAKSLQAAAAQAARLAQQRTAALNTPVHGQPTPLAGLGVHPHAGAITGGTQFASAFSLPGIPSLADLQRLRQLLAAQAAQSPNVFSRLGAQAGIQRTFGLNVGLAEENDPGFAGRENLDLRTQLTLARRIRELDERSEVENALIANERGLLVQTARLRSTLEQRQLAQRSEGRTIVGTSLDQARADERLAGERDRGRVTALVAGDTTPQITQELAGFRAANRARIAKINAAAANEERASKEFTDASVQALVARRRQQRNINAQAQRELIAGLGADERGTFTQRIQASIAARQGGPPRLPQEFLTGRQLLTSRALTTASFAASGALLYGGVQFVKELISEATALQVQLGIVESQLENAGDTGGRSFASIRAEIIAVSRETGVMANQVALVGRQLAGAFANPEGTPDFTRGLREAQSAFQLSRVTGLPEQEITDSLTAISLAFEQAGEDGKVLKVPFEEIGDTIIGLEQRFGVLAPEIVKFTADLAPLGAELGFTVTQLSALGAVAQQVSGRSGAVLSEQFGRILPALADRSADLLILFQENSKTAAQIPALSRALASRDLPAVLEQLVKGYSNFSDAQQNSLVSMVGSRREAAAFYALLARGEQTINALNLDPSEFEGAQDKRFQDFSQTVQFAFEQAQRAVEEFGIALFEAGLGDALRAIGQGAEFAAAGAGLLLDITTALNDATGGWAGKLGGVLLALFALNKTLTVTSNLYKQLAASQTLASLTSGGGFLRRGGPALGPNAPTRGPGGAVVPGVAGPLLGQGAVAGARGFLAANAPGLILLAGTIGFQLRQTGQNDLKEGVDFLREETRKALENGANPADLEAIGRSQDRKLSLGARASLIFHGQPTQSDVIQGEVDAFLADLRESQLKAIQQQLGEIDLGSARGGGTAARNTSADRNRRLTDEFIDRFASDPHGLADEALEFIESVDDPALRRRLSEMQDEFEAGVQEAAQRARATQAAADRLGSESAAVSLEELRAAVAEGAANPQDLITRLRERVADLDRVIASVRAAKSTASDEEMAEISQQLEGFLQQRQAFFDEIEGLAKQAIVDPADLRIRIRSALNLPNTDEENLSEVQQIIRDLEGLDPEEQLERVFQGIDLLRQIAESREQKTFTIPPEFRRILARSQLPTLVNNSEEGEDIAKLLNVSLQTVADRIGEEITKVGLDAAKIARALISGRRAILRRARQAAVLLENFRVRESRLSDIDEEMAALDQAEADLTKDVNGLIEGTEGTGSTGYVPEKKEDLEDPDDLARRIAEANLAVRRARANGDPIQLARLAQEAANIQIRFAKDEAERLQGIAAYIEASNQLRDAQNDIAQAYIELGQARYANDAVASARLGAAAAAAAVRNAKGAAEKLRAQAQKVEADRAVRDAIRDVFTSQQELLIAIANAAGNTVEAARLQLVIARQNLQNLIREGGGQAEINRAKSEIVSAQAAVRDAQFSDQIGDIDFLLEMERISVQQAIQMLQRLAEIPGATEEMIRTIERRIKQLRDEVSGDLAFNLPDIKLPTLYEVRRLMQSGNPEGTGGYQDNRVVTFGDINIGTDVDAQSFLDELGEIVGAAPTTGNYPGLY